MAKIGIQESGDDLPARAIVELRAAVLCAGYEDQSHGKVLRFAGLREIFGLLRWHLRVGGSVDEEKRRIVLVEVGHRAGELRKTGLLVGMATKEKFQRGHSHTQAVFRAL